MRKDVCELLLKWLKSYRRDFSPTTLENVIGVLESELQRGFQQGDLDAKGNVILMTFSPDDLQGNIHFPGVIPEGYTLNKGQMETFVGAVQQVDTENFRESVEDCLTECFVSQVFERNGMGLWDAMPKTTEFQSWEKRLRNEGAIVDDEPDYEPVGFTDGDEDIQNVEDVLQEQIDLSSQLYASGGAQTEPEIPMSRPMFEMLDEDGLSYFDKLARAQNTPTLGQEDDDV